MAPPPVEKLQHWTLVARDVERSKRFYVEVHSPPSGEGADVRTHQTLCSTVLIQRPVGAAAQLERTLIG